MFDNKSAIFIDTNVFEKIGYNFDERNPLISQFKILLKSDIYENVLVSVIDNEIKQHINKKIEDNIRGIKKHCKWIYNLIEESKIDEKINKDLNDYKKFIEDTGTMFIDLSNINPEIVMEKYFNLKAPFESSKQNEFKDAFFLEAIYKFIDLHEDYLSYIVITNDKGIIKAIEQQNNKKIVYFNTIQEFLESLIGYSDKDKKELFDYISSYNFDNQIREKIKVNIMDIEEEEIDIDNYSGVGIYFPKIIKKSLDKVIVVCDMHINLMGNFKCLDYENSYYSNEEGEYLYKQYKEKTFLGYVCQSVIEITIDKNKFLSANIIDLPEIDISYESFKDIEDYFE